MGTETELHSGWSEFTGYQDGAKPPETIVHGVFLKAGYKIEQNRIFAQYYGTRMRTALLVDVHSLYMGCNRKYPGTVLDYGALLSEITGEGFKLFVKTAYGRQPEENVPQFAKVLRRLGFDLKFGSGPHNVAMAVEALQLVGAVDHLILATNYHELAGITSAVRRQGIYTTVWGFDVPKVFEHTAQVYEIPPTMTQKVN